MILLFAVMGLKKRRVTLMLHLSRRSLQLKGNQHLLLRGVVLRVPPEEGKVSFNSLEIRSACYQYKPVFSHIPTFMCYSEISYGVKQLIYIVDGVK